MAQMPIVSVSIADAQPIVKAMQAATDEIKSLTSEVEELRKFVQAEYVQYPKHNPYAHELRKKFPWLEKG